MEYCEYAAVDTRDNVDGVPEDGGKISWKHFVRQVIICSAVWTSFVQAGLCFGSPTVTIPQIRRELNSTEAVTEEMASWLSSAFFLGGIPWTVLLPILIRWIGRKKSFILVSLNTPVWYLVFSYSTNVTQLLIAQLMQGLIFSSAISIMVFVITEYTSPEYRGLFLTIKSGSLAWGIWGSNVIGTFFHWRWIGGFGILCSVYILGTTFFWPESPYWLASKGRIDECIASHRWLKGTHPSSSRELDKIIEHQQSKVKREKKIKFTEKLKLIYSKPVLLATLLHAQNNSSGKIVFSVYAIEIIKKMTNSESAAYTGMLIVDIITILGMYVGCALSKYFARRLLLFTTAAISAAFLFTLSLYFYLINLSILTGNNFVSISLLIAFSLSISIGPMILCTSISGEVLPVQSRSFSICIISLYGNAVVAFYIKFAPVIFKVLNSHGAFLFYGTMLSIFSSVLYKYLPETKDKTLLEIENSMK